MATAKKEVKTKITVIPAGPLEFRLEVHAGGDVFHYIMKVIEEKDTKTGEVTGRMECSCPEGKAGKWCKHQRAVTDYRNAEERAAIADLESRADGAGQSRLALGIPAPDDQSKKYQSKIALGYDFGEVTSAMQKEVRAGNVERAVYWGLLLYDASAMYAWKRVCITAAEDVGFGDPDAVERCCAMAAAWKMIRETSYYVSPHLFTMAIAGLCMAKRSTWVEDLQSWTQLRIKRGDKLALLPEYIDGHTARGKAAKVSWSPWYIHRHQKSRIPVNEYTLRLWKADPSWKAQLTASVPFQAHPGDTVNDNVSPAEIDQMLERRDSLGVPIKELGAAPFKVEG